MQKIISVVLPIFNEAQNIPIIHQELTQVLEPYTYELIFVDDGSADSSWQLIEALAQQDQHVRGITLSRNFGHQAALMAGYHAARGDAIITMDADLQDPPALLPDLIAQWERGATIVYARRTNRADGILKRMTAWLFYWGLNLVADSKMPRNVGDFRLIDKAVVHTIRQCKEPFLYLRGLVAWTGYPHAFVDFKRPNRHAGSSGYTWAKMFTLALNGVIGFSLFPLRIAAFIGTIIVFSGTMFFCYAVVTSILGITYVFATWAAIIAYCFFGLHCMLIWLVGEYIGRIYRQQQNRPLFIVHKETALYKIQKQSVIQKREQEIQGN